LLPATLPVRHVWKFPLRCKQGIASLIRLDRDFRIDFLRGLALWWVFIDHVPKSWLNKLSLRELAFCDSAELFVLLAGISSGLAYGKVFDRSGFFSAAAKILRRIGTLYQTHILMFVLFTAEIVISSMHFGKPAYLEYISFDVVIADPLRSIVEAALLRFQPMFLDILPLYIVLLTMFAMSMLLLKRPRLLLMLSASLYLVSRLFDLSLPYWIKGWTFNPLTWQLLFMIGAVCAYAPKFRSRSRAFDWCIAGLLLICVALYQYHHFSNLLPSFLQFGTLEVDKSGLHPLRLISILTMAWLAWRFLPAKVYGYQARIAKPLILIGQHSLPVFCCGVLLSIFGQIVMDYYPSWTGQMIVSILGATILFGVAVIAAWYARASSMRSARYLP
jgi:hypothetical protein